MLCYPHCCGRMTAGDVARWSKCKCKLTTDKTERTGEQMAVTDGDGRQGVSNQDVAKLVQADDRDESEASEGLIRGSSRTM